MNPLGKVERRVHLHKGSWHLRSSQVKLPNEFTTLNPPKVPFLEDNGVGLPESAAILTYLAARYCTPEHWHPRQVNSRCWADSLNA